MLAELNSHQKSEFLLFNNGIIAKRIASRESVTLLTIWALYVPTVDTTVIHSITRSVPWSHTIALKHFVIPDNCINVDFNVILTFSTLFQPCYLHFQSRLNESNEDQIVGVLS